MNLVSSVMLTYLHNAVCENAETGSVFLTPAPIPSTLARYQSLSGFQKLQYWLQSHQYEMALFALVYVNVSHGCIGHIVFCEVLWWCCILGVEVVFSSFSFEGTEEQLCGSDMSCLRNCFGDHDYTLAIRIILIIIFHFEFFQILSFFIIFILVTMC